MWRFVVLAVVLISNPLAHGDDAADKKVETEWVKDVATDFLKALKARDYTQARQVLTPSLAKQFPSAISSPGLSISTPPRSIDSPPNHIEGTIETWEFTKDKIAPDKNEVVLEGVIGGRTQDIEYEFPITLRLVKEKDSGRWRIDYFLIEKGRQKAKKK